MVQPLRGFELTLSGWRQGFLCDQLTLSEVKTFFQAYTPGEHWLQLNLFVPKEEALSSDFDLLPWAEETFLQLRHPYKFAAWREDNNYVFG